MTGFEQLERELLAAERRLSGGADGLLSSRPRRPRFRVDLAAAGLAVFVALAVAVGAIALAGHRVATQPAARRSHAALRTLAAHPLADLARLRHELAVLRSPQTAAARRWLDGVTFHRLTQNARPGPIASSVRVLSLPDGDQLVLYLVDSQHLVGLGYSERRGTSGGGGCCITAQELDRPVGPGPWDWQSGRIPPQVYYELVPNGVARVRWTFSRHGNFGRMGRVPLRVARRRARLGPPPVDTRWWIGDPNLAPLTVTVRVHDNVAARLLPNRGLAISEIWFSATGRVIAHRGRD